MAPVPLCCSFSRRVPTCAFLPLSPLQVEVEVESMDKVGNFIGWLHIDGVNLAVALVEQALSKVHFTAERSNYYKALMAAEEAAKPKKEKVRRRASRRVPRQVAATGAGQGHASPFNSVPTEQGAPLLPSPPVELMVAAAWFVACSFCPLKPGAWRQLFGTCC